MDMTGNDANVEPPKGSEGTVNYHAPNMPSNWHVNENNITNTSIAMITMANSMVESSACSSAPVVDSLCPPIWDQPINGQNLGYCDVSVQNDAGTSSSLGLIRAGTGWSTPNSMLKEGMFLPNVSRVLPHSLPHFPADSAFIDRAARFSCFNGGNFSEWVNPFSTPDPLNPHSWAMGPMQGLYEDFIGKGSQLVPGMQSQRHEMNITEISKEASLPVEHGIEGIPFKNDKKSKNLVQSHDDTKNGVDASGNQSDEAEFSGCDAQEELDATAGESSRKGLGLKKRRRTEQRTERNENNEAPEPSIETAKGTSEREKGDQNKSSTSNPGGKHRKQGSQGSDPPKEEYIHVRARRGQATNSHSLAERVRREKISERMKFLQDLVPGCSKVTGKAVMLDEIINYVQSLQRQVEFLSMKLATVNPLLDFNMEGFLAKDIPQARAGLSSSLVFPPDMTMPFPLHPPPPGLIQAGLPGIGNSSETFLRPINLQSSVPSGGFKEPSVWDDKLHNVVHSGFNSSASLNSQDLSDSFPPGRTKAEP